MDTKPSTHAPAAIASPSAASAAAVPADASIPVSIQPAKAVDVREHFRRVLNALEASTWSAFTATLGIAPTNYSEDWKLITADRNYLTLWVILRWIPAAEEIGKLYSNGRTRILGLRLKLKLGPHPRTKEIRKIVEVTELHFLQLAKSEPQMTLVDSIVDDLSARLASGQVDSERLHLYFDYLRSHLEKQFVRYLQELSKPRKKGPGRPPANPVVTAVIDKEMAENNGKVPRIARIMELLDCTSEQAEVEASNARARQRSRAKPRKRLPAPSIPPRPPGNPSAGAARPAD